MNHAPSLRRVPPLLPFVAGIAVGALSWLAASVVSGTFEPYDSSAGLLVNQLVLCSPAFILALRHRMAVPFLLLAGAYFGMNAYAYGFGGSGQRAWVGLGAAVSLLLLVLPATLTIGAAILRRLRRPRSPVETNAPQTDE